MQNNEGAKRHSEDIIWPTMASSNLAAKNSLPSPVDPICLKYLLEFYGYDPILTAKLVKGFREGFSLGFYGKPNSDLKVA